MVYDIRGILPLRGKDAAGAEIVDAPALRRRVGAGSDAGLFC